MIFNRTDQMAYGLQLSQATSRISKKEDPLPSQGVTAFTEKALSLPALHTEARNCFTQHIPSIPFAAQQLRATRTAEESPMPSQPNTLRKRIPLHYQTFKGTLTESGTQRTTQSNGPLK